MLNLDDATRPRFERQALRVAVPHGVDRGSSGGAGEDRVVGRNRPVAVHSQDLAVQYVRVLRVRGISGVAHRDPELSVGTEADAAAVVVAVRAHPRTDDIAVEDRGVAVHPVAQHLIEPLASIGDRDAHVQDVVRRERRIQLDAHESGLTGGADVGYGEHVRKLRRTGRCARVD